MWKEKSPRRKRVLKGVIQWGFAVSLKVRVAPVMSVFAVCHGLQFKFVVYTFIFPFILKVYLRRRFNLFLVALPSLMYPSVCVFPSFLPDRFSTWCVSHSIVISDCLSSEFCLFIWTCCLRSHGLCLPYRFWPSLHLALSSVSASGSSPCAFCTSIAQVRSVLAITEAELHQFISMLLCLVAFC